MLYQLRHNALQDLPKRVVSRRSCSLNPATRTWAASAAASAWARRPSPASPPSMPPTDAVDAAADLVGRSANITPRRPRAVSRNTWRGPPCNMPSRSVDMPYVPDKIILL